MSPDLHPKRVEQPAAARPKIRARAIDILIEEAWEAGWWCETTERNHVRCLSPDGEHIVILPSTPSDHRGIKNARALLRRYGLKL